MRKSYKSDMYSYSEKLSLVRLLGKIVYNFYGLLFAHQENRKVVTKPTAQYITFPELSECTIPFHK